MQKTCSRCSQIFLLEKFPRRNLSTDGFAAACKSCINKDKQTKYWVDPVARAAHIVQSSAAKAARFDRDPAYKKAWNLWGKSKKIGHKNPPWVKITDFIPICKKFIAKGPGHEIDHIIPRRGKLVCGLHVPANMRVVLKFTNQKKSNYFAV